VSVAVLLGLFSGLVSLVEVLLHPLD
jgi:hypothetical protein